jgi:ATP-binding cassette subfamily C protein
MSSAHRTKDAPSDANWKQRAAPSIAIGEVCFSYHQGKKLALSNISMLIPSGHQVAIIGKSGSGKSTLADLILGISKPSSGDILIDGMTPQTVLAKYPGFAAYIPQTPGLVSGSLAENIALGVPADLIDKQRLDEAVRGSDLSALISELPDGAFTDIGKRKDELSGGQIQRIGMARALYTQPKLLLMDEATSALDAESEDAINRFIDRLRGKTTVIMIAHRLHTIQRADSVYLLTEGTIEASGKFTDLVKTNETLGNLAKLVSIGISVVDEKE